MAVFFGPCFGGTEKVEFTSKIVLLIVGLTGSRNRLPDHLAEGVFMGADSRCEMQHSSTRVKRAHSTGERY